MFTSVYAESIIVDVDVKSNSNLTLTIPPEHPFYFLSVIANEPVSLVFWYNGDSDLCSCNCATGCTDCCKVDYTYNYNLEFQEEKQLDFLIINDNNINVLVTYEIEYENNTLDGIPIVIFCIFIVTVILVCTRGQIKRCCTYLNYRLGRMKSKKLLSANATRYTEFTDDDDKL
jgi:hypothetical protein